MTREEEERLVADLSARQHGLVTRAQLLAAGMSPRVVERRVAWNRLRPVRPGVYQVGPAPLRWAREMAGILACGPGTFLSHLSAAAIWNMAVAEAGDALVHITVVGRYVSEKAGLAVHRVHALDSSEVTEVDGLPVTAPARTLFDLAASLRGRQLEQALARAEELQLTSRAELLALTPRYSRRRGIHVLRQILEAGAEPALARSEAEERFLALIRKARLASPKTNTRVGDYEVDFLWRSERLIVEVDGFAFHSSARMFERDRRKDADLAAMGFRVMRVTWRQLIREPEVALVLVAQTLARCGSG